MTSSDEARISETPNKKPPCIAVAAFQILVPGAGIEPARLAAGDFESPASTNFTTRARGARNL